jgi:glutathione S-transferase
VSLPFPPRAHDRSFLAINPLGTVPFLSHERAPPLPSVGITESCAGPIYLASVLDAPSLAVQPSEAAYGEFLNFCFHADATLTFPQALYLRYTKFEAHRKLEEVGEDYAKWFNARLKLLNGALEDGREYLVADRFTCADINVAYALILARELDLDKKFPWKPSTAAYLDRMLERPGYEMALQEEKDGDAKSNVTATFKQ